MCAHSLRVGDIRNFGSVEFCQCSMLRSSIEEISSNLFLTTEAMTRASNRNVSKQVPFQVVQEEPFIFSFASIKD